MFHFHHPKKDDEDTAPATLAQAYNVRNADDVIIACIALAFLVVGALTAVWVVVVIVTDIWARIHGMVSCDFPITLRGN